MHDYGFILKQLRKINGHTLKTASTLIGKSEGWFCEVENNRGLSRLKPEEFERVVKLFGGEKHRELFKTWVATEKNKSKADRTLDGAVLKFIREKRGLSLAQAAPKIGVSVRYLCQIENGRKPVDADLKDEIMRAYGYTPTSFRNYSRDERRSKSVPIRYKIEALLNQLDESDLDSIYKLAVKLKSVEKQPLSFLNTPENHEQTKERIL